MLGCRFSFAAPSAVLINIGKSGVLRTNLILEDRFSQMFQEAENLFIVLRVIDNPRQPRLLRQRPQFSLDLPELTGRVSALGLKGWPYRTISFRPGAFALPRHLEVPQKVRPSRLHVRRDLPPFFRLQRNPT